MVCPEENTITEFVAGVLSAADSARVEAHAAACPACRRLLSSLARSPSHAASASFTAPEDGASQRSLTRGALVGRYVVLETLGVGGTGVVYAAYDPELNRKVALKLLRSEALGRSHAQRGRLMREAQALARLSHPNVVAVYDVGTFGASVFIAMELIEGVTLGAWLAPRKHSWRAIVEIFKKVGQGLAAAHAEGLIHRDFKPANVLVGRDGRVCVVDFGLVRSNTSRTGADVSTSTDVAEPFDEITQAGAFLGTPAYMAPEQFENSEVDASADQFSFCVALFAALYQRRPYTLNTREVIRAEAQRGKLPSVEGGPAVPAFVRRVLERGLRLAPEERFPSMDALLAALSQDPRQTWRRRAFAGLGAGALGLSIFAAVQLAGEPAPLCQGSAAKFAQAWSDEAREAIHARFLATGMAHAEDIWATVARTLDAYGREWSAMHTDACEATRVRGEQSDELLSLRMLCLDRRWTEVRTLTALLRDADADGVTKAVDAAFKLTGVAACANLEALRMPVRPPEGSEQAAEARDIETALAQAKFLASLGQYETGLAEATRAVERARALGHPPTEAEALETLGAIQLQAVEPKAAEASLREAYATAQAGRHDRIAARAAIALVFVVGSQLFQVEAGREWAFHARAALKRWGADPELEGSLHANSGILLYNAGDFAAARAEFAASLAVREQGLGAEHRHTAQSLELLAMAASAQGDVDAAHTSLRRATELARRSFGVKHPAYGALLVRTGNQFMLEDRAAEAEALFAEALSIVEAARGKDHPQVALIVLDTSGALRKLGKLPAALDAGRRALRSFEATEGARPLVADALAAIGRAESDLGDLDAALAAHRKALAIYEEVFGPEHEQVANALENSGDVLLRRGDVEAALDHYERALALREKAQGAEFIDNAFAFAGIGEAHVMRGDAATAIPPLERAQALLERHQILPSLLARVRFLLARARWDAGQSRDQALRLAARAEEGFRALATPVGDADAARVAEWVANHD
ncbi:Serine/threonine protein kinase [Nannocystis exedens]|uniref:Serine/threonine protein kinase n=1 Tax=Nannocystis exedens TaxID=54 RepID=A0A1I2CX43_9BACT|nr:tetratricopeptide repeat protein [Nannocystis exedens]PCC68634.1 protein kinase [Nannocystis exedens]SFE72765.1 Serine/threonine protein kinase [Nannocystis exedens]